MATVKVTVVQPAGTNTPLSITVDPFILDLGSAGGSPVDIEWELDSSQAPGWDFTAPSAGSPPGIDIKNHVGKFTHGGKAGRKYKWKRDQTDNKDYKYSINLVRSDGRAATLDPFIVNR